MLTVSACPNKAALGLSQAILVYGHKGDIVYGQELANVHATIHGIEMSGGGPMIQAGRLLTESDLKTLVKGLTESQSLASPTWMEPTVLAMGAGRLIWYTPACVRAMFFKKSSLTTKSFTGHAVLPNPGLVWMIQHGALHVFAFKGTDRPTQETALYQAPFFNVWSQGKVCVGNAVMPTGDDLAIPSKWVDAFFGSHFTHPNFTERNRLVKGADPVRFWQGMTTKLPSIFPDDKLVEVPVSVGDLLSVDVSQKLAMIPRAKGEF